MALTVNDEEDEYFEDVEDVVFDRQQLLVDSSTALYRIPIQASSLTIHRISSGKFMICVKTLGLCGAFFGLGLCVALPDFTFSSDVSTDVQIVTGNSLSINLLTARSVGYIIGSFIAGFLFDRYNRQFLLFLSLLLTSVFIIVIPWCYSRMLLEINVTVLGITVGFLSTGGNVLCLDLWGKNSGPFMQALHFSFALGTFITPLMVESIMDRSHVKLNAINNSIYLTVKNDSREYVSFDGTRSVYDSLSELSLNKSPDQSNCHINKLSIYSSSYLLHINFSESLGRNSREVSAIIKYKLPLSNKVYNIQGVVNAMIPFHRSGDSSYYLLDTCDSGKNLTFNGSSDFDYKKRKFGRSRHVDDCDVYLHGDCKSVTILEGDLIFGSENLTFVDFSDNTETSNSSLLFNSEITKRLGDSSAMHISNLTCTAQFKTDTFNYDLDQESEIYMYRVESYALINYHLIYFLTGALIFILSALFFLFLCRNPRDPRSKQEEFRTKSKKASNICADIFLVPLTAWFLFLCVGLQATLNQLLSLYAINIRKTLPSTTDNLPTIFSASFTSMRFISVFFAIGLSPDTLLTINIITLSFGTLIFTSLGAKSNEALCTGCSVIGLGLATMVPTTILWIEQYIRVSNKITVVFVVGSTLGEMLFPFTVCKLMILNYDMFLYATILVNVLSSVTLVCLWLIMGKYTIKFCLGTRSGYHLANQNDEEDLKMTSLLMCLKNN